MADKIIQTGTGNLAFNDIHDSNFIIFISTSLQYQDLLHQLNREKLLLDRTPKNNQEERLKINEQINLLKIKIESFKRDIFQLNTQFTRIEINTERKEVAYYHFKKREFGEARAILEIALEQMLDEQNYLLNEKEHYENFVLPNLKNNADEFSILAVAAKATTEDSSEDENIINYFERSLKSHTDHFNTLEYISFLREREMYDKAEEVIKRTKIFDKENFNEDRIITELERLSWNYFWSWNFDGEKIWKDIDPGLWERCEQNPRLFLRRINRLRLYEKAADPNYVINLLSFSQKSEEYLERPIISTGGISDENCIAYFSMEYGIHNSLPIYAGGLGILAGDYLKSASDMRLPVVAVGLFFRYGYFRQKIAHNGWQEERYMDLLDNAGLDSDNSDLRILKSQTNQLPPTQLDSDNDAVGKKSAVILRDNEKEEILTFSNPDLALLPLLSEQGKRILISIDIRNRKVLAKVWVAKIGMLSLYLLDTNVVENNEADRYITGHLYGGDNETRIVQEQVLGIGGIRLLRELGINPAVFHMNGAQSAFLTLELAREYLIANDAANFEEAVEFVKQKCVFTTHTIFENGSDIFSINKIVHCFSYDFVKSLKISMTEFFALGKTPSDKEDFNMTSLALRMTRSTNGMSEKHGEVARSFWVKMYPEAAKSEDVPITHITNGVHPPTWIAFPFQRIYEKYIGKNWTEVLNDEVEWREYIDKIPDKEIWETHIFLKNLLVAYIRSRISSMIERLDDPFIFDPGILTIGFARSVEAYKRWNLLMTDLPRLLKLVDDANRPVQFVFAGKAHPQDRVGKQLLQNLMSINPANWQNRAVFIEDYDQEVARHLVQGVDVWMNVPRRPLEASGTSGQKSAMNGGLNFSILDGWWIEGYNGTNGFSIGEFQPGEDQAKIDAEDAESLYQVLENEIVPAYYTKGENGLPIEWIRRMKDALATLTPQFSSYRMLKDYIAKIYRL